MVKTKKGVQIFKFHRGFERLLLSILLSHIILYSSYQNLAVETFQHKINYVYTYYDHFVHQGNQ